MDIPDEGDISDEGSLPRNSNRRTFYAVTGIVAVVLVAMTLLYGQSLRKDVQLRNERSDAQISSNLFTLKDQIRSLIIYTEVITQLQSRAIKQVGKAAGEWGEKNFESYLINIPELYGFALVESGEILMRAGFGPEEISEESITSMGRQKGIFPARVVVHDRITTNSSGVPLLPITQRIAFDGHKVYAVVFLNSTKVQDLIRKSFSNRVVVSALVDNAGKILVPGTSRLKNSETGHQGELDGLLKSSGMDFQSVIASKRKLTGSEMEFSAVSASPFPINLIIAHVPAIRFSEQFLKIFIFAGGTMAGFVLFVFFFYRTSSSLDAHQNHLESLVAERTTELQHKTTLLETVLGNINQGLVAYDGELNLIVSNKRFREIRDVPDALAQPGTRYADWIAFDAARGEFENDDPEEAVQDLVTKSKKFEPYSFERTRPNGTIIEVAGGPLPDGGFVSTFSDITERKQADRKLADAYNVISDSIDYAGRIQRSVLPGDMVLQSLLLSHFIIWEPRDVVGGDTYWCRTWGDGVLLILGDCTGHGVPGAFMTLICTGALDRALIEIQAGDLSGLVQRMHQIIQKTLGQDGDVSESDDGVELGACFINAPEREMIFVGARFDLFEVTNSVVTRHRGDKKGIGYKEVDHQQEFRETTIDLDPSTTFYMTTDGLVDQVGGIKNRGFGKRRFEKLLLRINDNSMEERREAIMRELHEYQGNAPRLDDVAIFGFQAPSHEMLTPSLSGGLKPIIASQKIQSELESQGIFFCYSGYMSEDFLLSMGNTLRQKMAFVDASKFEARAIFSIFVEEAQNIIRYSSDVLSVEGETPNELRRGFLAIGKENDRYFVSCGNLIKAGDVERLRGHLEEISAMDADRLKKTYKQVLRGDVPEGSKGAGVGFIEIAKRAKNGFDFDFKTIDDEHSYFSLKAYV